MKKYNVNSIINLSSEQNSKHLLNIKNKNNNENTNSKNYENKINLLGEKLNNLNRLCMNAKGIGKINN
jgi:hypothetical protein